jgi:hypothetical protein
MRALHSNIINNAHQGCNHPAKRTKFNVENLLIDDRSHQYFLRYAKLKSGFAIWAKIPSCLLGKDFPALLSDPPVSHDNHFFGRLDTRGLKVLRCFLFWAGITLADNN